MSIYDKASLVLIPSGTKTSKVYSQKPVNGDGDFTFSRSTAATRVNADGNIEKETQNLLLQSNNFTSTWNVDTGITFTSGQSGYDGSSDAWKMDKTASDFLAIRQTPTYSGVVTFSLYAKQGTLRYLNFYTPTANAQIWFDLQTGGFGNQAGTYIKNKIEDVGGGWYRCSVTYNASSGGELRLYPTSSSAGYTAVAGNIYIQDAQLEQGLVARDYIETTTAAVEGGITDNVPRLDYTDSSCPALLLEPLRTNILENSEYAGTNNWGNPQRLTTIANQTTSPEGVVNATKVNETAVSGTHMFDYNFTATSGVAYTFSYFAKAAERTQCYLFGYTDGGVFSGQRAIFDLSNGTITSNVGNGIADIQPYSNGWYRVSLTLTSSATSIAGYWGIGLALNSATSYLGVASSGINMYGFQLEAGSYATSYIPTYGTSVTRNAETNRITGVSDVIGQTEGTIFMDWIPVIQSPQTHFSMSDGGSNIIGCWGTGGFTFYTSGGCLISGGGITTGERVKIAFGYKNNDFVAYVNGTQVGTDTSGSVPTCDRLFIGEWYNGTEKTKQEINQTLLFKTRLSNEELAALTTI